MKKNAADSAKQPEVAPLLSRDATTNASTADTDAKAEAPSDAVHDVASAPTAPQHPDHVPATGDVARPSPATAAIAADATVGAKDAASPKVEPENGGAPSSAAATDTHAAANAATATPPAKPKDVIRSLSFTGSGTYTLTVGELVCSSPFIAERSADGLNLRPAGSTLYVTQPGTRSVHTRGGNSTFSVGSNYGTVVQGNSINCCRIGNIRGGVINTGYNCGTMSCTQVGCSGNVVGVMNGGTHVYDEGTHAHDVIDVDEPGETRYSLADKLLDIYLIDMSGACNMYVDSDVPLSSSGLVQIGCSGACALSFERRTTPLASVSISASGAARVNMHGTTVGKLIVQASGVARVFPPRSTGLETVDCSGLAEVRG